MPALEFPQVSEGVSRRRERKKMPRLGKVKTRFAITGPQFFKHCGGECGCEEEESGDVMLQVLGTDEEKKSGQERFLAQAI